MGFDPYDNRTVNSESRWPLWAVVSGAVVLLGLGLFVWYLVGPESLARVYGQTLGPPLVVNYLEITVNGQAHRVPSWGEIEVNPKETIAIKGLNTNRWKNYDLLFYSPDIDVNQLVKGGQSLGGFLGAAAFLDPKTVTIEVRDEGKVAATFTLKGVFTAPDYEELALSAVEPERKIEYYRKALELDPKAPAYAVGFRAALEAAGRKDELIKLLESDLTAAKLAERLPILVKLLALYRDKKDFNAEITVLERLLALVEDPGATLNQGPGPSLGPSYSPENLRATLARAVQEKDPHKAVGLLETLAAKNDVGSLGYLNELVGLYRTLQNPGLEEATWVRMLPLAPPETLPNVLGEIIRLREARSDKPGLIEAYASLANLLPSGPAKANAHKRLGYLRYESGDLVGAATAYHAAIVEDPQDPAVFLNLARLALAQEDRVAYRDNLVKALALDDQPPIRLELAQALTKDGLKIDALREYEVLANLKGADQETQNLINQAKTQLVALARPEDGVITEAFETVLYQSSIESVEFYNLGVAHFQKKNWDKAIKAFLRALELDHQKQLEVDIRGYLLALYKETNQTAKMLAEANWIYPANPEKRDARDLIAHEFEKANDWAGLAKAATEWTGQADEAQNWRYLALAQRKLGKNKDAAESLLMVAKRDSKASTWLAAGEALEKVGSVKRAKTAYQRVMDLDPGNAKAEAALVRMAMQGLNKGR
ncbi:MAG: tetratricopeptide repeat protein [Deltaproteobacteria bacterium]|jgi:tetratricopeptide (TPR) repeat protein|nr:tetratricopeptide repeat protein [Deltaproteobacteria bacterium]